MYRTRAGRIVAGVAVLGALLGGCVFGGGDDDPTEVVPTATSTQGTVATNTPAAATETVAGATTTTTSPTPAGQTHTVEAGQSLGIIAGLYGTTVQALVDANGIADPNLIYPGQVLIIPGAAGSQ
ncbi:MAG: LysM peptidoglycan-binding domain-containing protein [Dehalococcoidia bacterium]|nr:LysM peptidoglycan-binding domain-containing protein [Dehalococcoidia bacterium]